MTVSASELTQLLARPEFPRAAGYDPRWVIANQMGPHPLWLAEWLCQAVDLQPGMRVLDLGCGRALSSIFLAREFGVQVWATDLWIAPHENLARIQEADLAEQVFPLHVDARKLPFAHGFFDAILCVDAFIYFGTDDLFLDYLHRFVVPGGPIGIVIPGFMQPLDGALPEHLAPFWAQECWTWHTIAWWRAHWARTGLLDISIADTLPGGIDAWLQWNRALVAAGDKDPALATDIAALEADQGRFAGFLRLVGRRRGENAPFGIG